jgi:hypothetical protein
MSTLIFWVVAWIVPFGIAFKMGRDRARRGWVWGLLGWIGVIVVWRLSDLNVPEDERELIRSTKSYEKALASATRKLEQARAPKVLGRYGKAVVLYEDSLATPHGTCALSPYITASVETEGSFQKYATSRLTATRMLTLGVFSLAAPKKKHHAVDTRALYLTIETPEFSSIVQCSPNASATVRSLAVAITNAGKTVGALQDQREQRIAQAEHELETVRVRRPELSATAAA